MTKGQRSVLSRRFTKKPLATAKDVLHPAMDLWFGRLDPGATHEKLWKPATGMPHWTAKRPRVDSGLPVLDHVLLNRRAPWVGGR